MRKKRKKHFKGTHFASLNMFSGKKVEKIWYYRFFSINQGFSVSLAGKLKNYISTFY
jgi:hypothetical protein